MNPSDGWGSNSVIKYKLTLLSTALSGKKSFSPHIIPKTKGLEERLVYGLIKERLNYISGKI